MIGVIARAVRANDLAAAGVARRQEMQHQTMRQIAERHAGAEARKRSLDAARLAKIRQHLHRIATACASRRELASMKRLVSEHEAAANLERYRPPPVIIPSDAGCAEHSPQIIWTPRHVDTPSSDSENGYSPDEESNNLSPPPRFLPEAGRQVARRGRAPTPMRPRRPARSMAPIELELYKYVPSELYEC